MLCTPRSSWISLQAEPVASSWCLARAFAATEHFLQSTVFPDTALPQKMPCDNKFLRHASTLKPQLSFRLKAGLSHILPGRYGATTGWSRPPSRRDLRKRFRHTTAPVPGVGKWSRTKESSRTTTREPRVRHALTEIEGPQEGSLC